MAEAKFLEREEAKVKFSEVYGSENVIEYCFLDEEYKAVHPQVRCKDFIQDLFWMSRLLKSTSDEKKLAQLKTTVVYGFKPYDFCSNYPFVDRDYYRVGIRFRTKGQDFRIFEEQQSASAIRLINQIETGLEFPTSIVSLSKKRNIIIFEFSSKWSETPYMMSFYLLLVRLVTKLSPVELDKIENFQEYILNYPKSNSGNDARIIVDSLYLLEKIFNKEKIQEQTWEEYESISSVHNNSGISSFSKLIKKTDEMKKSQKSILPISEELETFNEEESNDFWEEDD